MISSHARPQPRAASRTEEHKTTSQVYLILPGLTAGGAGVMFYMFYQFLQLELYCSKEHVEGIYNNIIIYYSARSWLSLDFLQVLICSGYQPKSSGQD